MLLNILFKFVLNFNIDMIFVEKENKKIVWNLNFEVLVYYYYINFLLLLILWWNISVICISFFELYMFDVVFSSMLKLILYILGNRKVLVEKLGLVKYVISRK